MGVRHAVLRHMALGTALTASFAACSGASPSDLFEAPSTAAPSNPGDRGGSPPPDSSIDAGYDAGRDAGRDAGAENRGIFCGVDPDKDTAHCNAETQYCCASSVVRNTRTCMDKNISLCAGIRVDCDSANDCARGEVCCGVYNDSLGYTSIGCKPRAQCEGNASPENSFVRFCAPHANVDECASSDETCQASNSIKGYFVCGS